MDWGKRREIGRGGLRRGFGFGFFLQFFFFFNLFKFLKDETGCVVSCDSRIVTGRVYV